MNRRLYRVTAWLVSVTCVTVLIHLAFVDVQAYRAYVAVQTAMDSITESWNKGLSQGDPVSTVPGPTDPATGNVWDNGRMCWLMGDGQCDPTAPVEHD